MYVDKYFWIGCLPLWHLYDTARGFEDAHKPLSAHPQKAGGGLTILKYVENPVTQI